MAVDTGSPRTRRAVLGAAVGAAMATVAQAVGRPLPVRAAGDDGLPILLGGLYANVQSQTTIANQANNGVVMYVASNSGNGAGAGIGVWGYSAHGTAVRGQSGSIGLEGLSDGGTAIRGVTTSGTGVFGQSTSGVGIAGSSQTGAGVSGYSSQSPGVGGTSGSGDGVRAESQTGIGINASSGSGTAVVANTVTGHGVQGSSSAGRGVYGLSGSSTEPAILGWSHGERAGVLGYSGGGSPPAETGVYGYATQDASSRGVHGYSSAGRGVYGQSTTGTAGYFATGDATKGTSLRATGRVRLDRCAGVATVPAGAKSVTVGPGIDLVSTAAVVATLQGSAGGTTTVHRCSINPTANTFTIYLTANSSTNVKVAWHVFG